MDSNNNETTSLRDSIGMSQNQRVFNHAILISLGNTNNAFSFPRDINEQRCFRFISTKNRLLDEDEISISSVKAYRDPKDEDKIIVSVTTKQEICLRKMQNDRVSTLMNNLSLQDHNREKLRFISREEDDSYNRETLKKIIRYIFGDLLRMEVYCLIDELFSEEKKKKQRATKMEILRKIVNIDAIDPNYANKLEKRLCMFLAIITVMLPWTPVTTELILGIRGHKDETEAFLWLFAETLCIAEKYIL